MLIQLIPRDKKRQAFTLTEMSVTIVIASILSAALMFTIVFGVRSMAIMNNYTALLRNSRMVMDVFTADIRQCTKVTAQTPGFPENTGLTSISLTASTTLGTDTYTFTFNNGDGTFTRIKNGAASILLTNCVGYFDVYQPKLQLCSWDQYDKPSGMDQIGFICVRFTSKRDVLRSFIQTEDVVTAKVLMRNCQSL